MRSVIAPRAVPKLRINAATSKAIALSAAVADDATALHWNPAGLARTAAHHSVCLTHNAYINTSRQDFGAYARRWERAAAEHLASQAGG